MAEKMTKEEKEEPKIPVFTVLKNGVILKNIFLNGPPSVLEPRSSKEDRESGEKPYEEDEKLLVGRHPDCHIVLDHPSISRFHIQITSQPSLQRISVIDLSSVHGTWVSGRKIESHVAVEMLEGDTLRLGASTRFYKLHWVPWSQAFKTGQPFIPPVEAPQEEGETSQNENVMSPVKKRIDSWTVNVPSSPPVLESTNSSSPVEVSSDAKMLTERENLNLEGTLAALSLFEAENKSPEKRMPEQNEIARHWAAPLGAESMSSLVPVEILSAAHGQLERNNHSPGTCFNGDVLPSDNRENESPPVRRSEKQNTPSSIWSRRCKSVSFLRIQTRRTGEKINADIDGLIKVEDQKENANVEQCMSREPLGKVLFEESYQSDKENLTPLSVVLKPRENGVEKLQIELEKLASKEEELPSKAPFEELFPSDKENITPMTSNCLKSNKAGLEMRHVELQKLSLKGIVVDMDVEGGIFPSDKENLTPNPSQDSKLKKPTSKSHQRMKQDMLKRNATRLPFQPLLENSTDKTKSLSVLHPSPGNSNSANHSPIANGNNSTSFSQSVDPFVHNLGEGKRKWNMVVDTSTLLDEESRKSLKLLEGLKGTHLIIPRMVVRELDCLRRQGSRFRRGNEAFSILQWIEECMVKTRWWIHVQSTAESVPIAPTPPASPQSRLSSGSVDFPAGTTSSVPFSTCGSLMEIVSPTAEDHILECALLFKRIKDGQLVLLSNDVALKIKAMAEGLICETAMEFRDSLVNPCSKRFMWAESTPFGPTWSSCWEDAVLKENYVYCPPAIRKTGKATEGAKGLKLILLHNSQYGQMNQVR